MKLMIYGAYGYTGELISEEVVRRGINTVLAGRSKEKLATLAEELNLEFRSFDVEDAYAHLDEVSVLLNCAGPFSSTAKELAQSCIEKGIHYLDITGEIDVFQLCKKMDEKAQTAGVILCPGVGFDIVPTDCLAAHLKEKQVNAHTINLAFSFGTKPSIGTAKTALEGIDLGGLIRKNHQLVSVPNGYQTRRIPFQNGTKWCVTIPWADVYTSGISTGSPNGRVYTALSLPIGCIMRLSNPVRGLFKSKFMQKFLNKMIRKRFAGGPDEDARKNQRSQFWGEALSSDNQRTEMSFSAPNVYSFTVYAALGIAEFCLNSKNISGYKTPSMLMGSNYVFSLPDVSITR